MQGDRERLGDRDRDRDGLIVDMPSASSSAAAAAMNDQDAWSPWKRRYRSPSRPVDLQFQQAEELMDDAKKMRARPELLDVTFICEGSDEVRANRAFLAMRSDYFSKLLYGGMRESRMDAVPLPHARAKTLETIVDFLHGNKLDPTCLSCEDMVDVYCMAEEYQIRGLGAHVAHYISSMDSFVEVGKLLKASIPREADAVLRIAMRVFDERILFDFPSFKGWCKDSIIYCLNHSAFLDGMEVKVVAEAVLEAVTQLGGASHDQQQKQKHHQDKENEEEEEEEGVCGLSKEDVVEIFELHLKMERMDPRFLAEKVQPLAIFPEKRFSDVYLSQLLHCFSKLQDKSDYTIQGKKIEKEVSWNEGVMGSGMCPSPQFPNRIWCDLTIQQRGARQERGARLGLPLCTGKHFWQVRLINPADSVWFGVVDSKADAEAGFVGRENEWMYGSSRGICMSNTHKYPFEPQLSFRTSLVAIIILDMEKRTLTFANDMESYGKYRGKYPVAFTNLPDTVHPAVSLLPRGCLEMQWVHSFDD